MRISYWSSDVCSSDLSDRRKEHSRPKNRRTCARGQPGFEPDTPRSSGHPRCLPRGAIRLPRARPETPIPRTGPGAPWQSAKDRKSVGEGKSVSVRVDLGGRRIIKKKKNTKHKN